MTAPLLMTPGPTRVPTRVLEAGARPMIHHRSPELSEALAAVIAGMRRVFGTRGDVLPVHTTGRGAMEASICNLFSAGDEIVACCNGKFGVMWARFAESHGLVVHRIATDWERSVSVDGVAAALEAHLGARAVTVVHSDTSTGVLNDVAGVAAVARAHGALTLVDSISGVGGVPFDFDGWGVDVAVTASQKCLMSSPGMAFVAIGPDAWQASESASLPRNYWDFQAIRETLSGPQTETPGTTPVHVVLQLQAALAMLEEEGHESVVARHEEMACQVHEWAAARGLTPQCPELTARSPVLSAFQLPQGHTPAEVRRAMRERGILIAIGLGPYAETAIRLGHMGDIRPSDVRFALGELDAVLDRR